MTIEKETFKKAFKPFDIVTNKNGDVGFIQEVSVNDCQEGFYDQISYAVNWLVGNETKHAWFDHNELTAHCNLFIKISENVCNSTGNSAEFVTPLFSGFNLTDKG
jgi:hypothetical protein